MMLVRLLEILSVNKVTLYVITVCVLISIADNSYAETRPCLDDSFMPVISSMGDNRLRYIDPELLKGNNRIVFQDESQRLWLGNLDPSTGMFSSVVGRDLYIDTGIAPIPSSRNGAEWGFDSRGVAIFYTKADILGTLQMWRARITQSGTVRTRQLTTGIQPSRGFRPSFLANPEMTYLFYMVGTASNFETVWSVESDPDNTFPVSGFHFPSAGARFVSGPDPAIPQLLYVHKDETTPETQIALLDTGSNQVQIITNDAGEKFEPRMFKAAEFGGESLIAALIDRQTLAIYRDLGAPDGYWTRIEELYLPAGETNTVLYSMKPVDSPAGQIGINGTTYFSLVANQFNSVSNPGDTSMWLLGLGTDPGGRLCRRLDEGAITGASGFRYEPETYLGDNDLFFFYNVANPADPELGQLRVVKTGITLGP